MIQQVNLYQPVLRKQKKIFSAITMLQANLLVLLGLLALYLYTVLQTHNMAEQLLTTQQQRDRQVSTVAQLTAKYPPRGKDTDLPGRIEQSRARLQRNQRLLSVVQELGLDQPGGFSAHLAGLAQQDLPDLWLQQIHLQYGQRVALSGTALRAEEVPHYLQRLSTEPAFNGTAFHSVVIARADAPRHQVEFKLHSRDMQEVEQ